MARDEQHSMGAAAWTLLALNAVVWSSSFLFIKVAVAAVDPVTLTFARTMLGAMALWAAAWMSSAPPTSRARSESGASRHRYTRRERAAIISNAALTAAPFTLIGWAETRIDSGLAGILNATTPLWATVLALRYDREHHGGARRMAGMLLGFAGVTWLLGSEVHAGSSAVAMLAVLAGAAMYGTSAIVVRSALREVDPTRTAAWSCLLSASVTLVPAAWLQGPHLPPLPAIASIAMLGLFATGLGMFLYYQLLALVGASRASMVTYLMPPLAVVYGALLLDEHLGIAALAAMGVILLGVWIGSSATVAPSGGAPEGTGERSILEPAEPPVD